VENRDTLVLLRCIIKDHHRANSFSVVSHRKKSAYISSYVYNNNNKFTLNAKKIISVASPNDFLF